MPTPSNLYQQPSTEDEAWAAELASNTRAMLEGFGFGADSSSEQDSNPFSAFGRTVNPMVDSADLMGQIVSAALGGYNSDDDRSD